MNEDREIDPIRYPNFAALARNANWFRNATTVSDYTHMACPAILSGIYPDKPRLPTAADYPHNIFTLLGGSYDLIVDDPNTQLCPERLCGKWAERGKHENLKERISSLLLDLSVAYLHIVLPSDLSAGLPVVTRSWKGFMGDDMLKPEKHAEQKSLTPLKQDFWLNYVTGERPRQFVRFIKSIDYSEQPTLCYLHIVIPHEPWRYLPTGKEYTQPAEYKRIRGLSGFGHGETWNSDEWAVVQAYQRYLLQVGFVDRLLGAIIDRIRAVGLYDRSLIVVTADHGISFRPDDKRRPITKTNYQDIMPIPLLIKVPNQHEGVISDRNIESIDILPTVADILGISLPWAVDGQSVFNLSISERTKKFFFRSTKDKKDVERLVFKASIDEKYDTVDQMIALFGSGVKPDGLFKIGPHNNLVGQHVSEIGVVEGSGIMVELDQARLYEHVAPDAPFVPAQITGCIMMAQPIETTMNLAVSVNGIIRAVTRTYRVEGSIHEWSAIVPELSFRPGKNDIEVFHLAQDTGRLHIKGTRRKSAVTYFLSGPGAQNAETIITSEGKSIPVIPGALVGFVDRAGISNDRVKFSGWAADIKNSELPEAILIFVSEKFVYSGRTCTGRPDVVKAYGDATLQRSGFVYALLLEDFKGINNPEVRVFAVSKKGIASELHYLQGYKWGRKS
ncbi:MAG: sulfatase-like hydrolase/transferase [Proteobacteria bacterium]|nr:sulfatase-like hydrolase/transferase [Pseudomonadota bacterium]